jgi:hypothetical protein
LGKSELSISVEWGDEAHTVVYWEFPGTWSWKDYADAQEASHRLLETVDHTVAFIGNMASSPLLPANALTAYRGYVQRSAENTGLIVLVGASRLVKTMVQVFLRINPRKGIPGTDFAFADTVEEAYALIAQKRGGQSSEVGS